MRYFVLCAILYLLMPFQPVHAQYYYFNDKYYDHPVVFEAGISGGLMNSFTDLGGKKGIGKDFIKDLNWKFARPSYGVYIMATYQGAVSLRIEGTFGEVKGYDSVLRSVKETTTGRYERNLSFKSRISEIQLAAEVHPLYIFKKEDTEPPISPYVVGGVGYFSFDPQAFLNGQWYALHPLRTEGQGFAEYPDRKPYELNQINFSLGGGVRYEVSPQFNARLEINHRILRTDYLDDVSTTYIDPALFYDYLPLNRAAVAEQISYRGDEVNPNDMYPIHRQRGDPKDKDAYFTMHLKLGFVLGRQRR
jgi:hypothetical protein